MEKTRKITQSPRTVTAAIREYTHNYKTYEAFTSKLHQLLDDILAELDLQFLSEKRTKSIESFRSKATRVDKLYRDPLEDVTDLCGLRVIVRRPSDVSRVLSAIREQFSVDEAKSENKLNLLNVDQFGYSSVHLVIALSAQRAGLNEWKRFRNLKAEVQVRTVVQHAWAWISHSFDYKVKADVPPEFRRRLFRLSALFELADEELDAISDEIAKKQLEYEERINQGVKSIELNATSLKVYVERADATAYWASYIENELNIKVDTWGNLSRDVKIARFLGVTTLDSLDDLLLQAKGWGENFLLKYYEHLARTFKLDLKHLTIVRNGPITLLLIASKSDKLTPDILRRKFGYSAAATFVLDVASAVKR